MKKEESLTTQKLNRNQEGDKKKLFTLIKHKIASFDLFLHATNFFIIFFVFSIKAFLYFISCLFTPALTLLFTEGVSFNSVQLNEIC